MEQHSVAYKYDDIRVLELFAIDIGHNMFEIVFYQTELGLNKVL